MSVVLVGGTGGLAAKLIGDAVPETGTQEFATGINSIYSAYNTFVASLFSQSTGMCLSGTCTNNSGVNTKFFIQVAMGAAGLEIPIASIKLINVPGQNSLTPFTLFSNQLIPANQRLSLRSYVEAAVAGVVMFGWTISLL